MDKEQLEKKVKWLDDERRKDKGTITDLQKKIETLEGLIEKSAEHIKGLSGEVTRSKVMLEKFDEYDKAIVSHRQEVKKELDNQEKLAKRRETEFKKSQKLDLVDSEKAIAKLQNDFKSVTLLKDELLAKQEGDIQRTRLMAEMHNKMEKYADAEAERQQAAKMMADERRQEEKRIADMQAEITALRKRSDEYKARIDLVVDGQKKTDARLAETISFERERREKQTEFAERISLKIADQEKNWKTWQDRFTTIEEQSKQLSVYLQNLDDVQRKLTKAQKDFEEINQQIGRRINEITEMQRLGDERFRQEWAAFKSEDQKRWANYALLQEEAQRSLQRETTRLANQFSDLEENLQEVQDVAQHLSDQTEKSFHGILSALKEWVSENERFSRSLK